MGILTVVSGQNAGNKNIEYNDVRITRQMTSCFAGAAAGDQRGESQLQVQVLQERRGRSAGQVFRTGTHAPELFTVTIKTLQFVISIFTVQELCESRGGRPGLSVLTSLLVSVDVKNY